MAPTRPDPGGNRTHGCIPRPAAATAGTSPDMIRRTGLRLLRRWPLLVAIVVTAATVVFFGFRFAGFAANCDTGALGL